MAKLSSVTVPTWEVLRLRLSLIWRLTNGSSTHLASLLQNSGPVTWAKLVIILYFMPRWLSMGKTTVSKLSWSRLETLKLTELCQALKLEISVLSLDSKLRTMDTAFLKTWGFLEEIFFADISVLIKKVQLAWKEILKYFTQSWWLPDLLLWRYALMPCLVD